MWRNTFRADLDELAQGAPADVAGLPAARRTRRPGVGRGKLAEDGPGLPVISVDTRKKDLVGPFRNDGREWRPKRNPEKVNAHGNITADKGRVSVGTDNDTASFAAESVRRWWINTGRPLFNGAGGLPVTTAGGSNSGRNHLWKLELQRLADEIGMNISACHFPPGTSKWNKIEHLMFRHISRNWHGRPLVSRQVVVELIAATTTRSGLKIRSKIDDGQYPLGVKVSDEQMEELNIRHRGFHGQWNYTLINRQF